MTNFIKLESDVLFVAAAAGDSAPRKRFQMSAYTGNLIRQGWSKEPVVIDLAGMELRQQLPVVLGHEYGVENILGQTTSIRVEAGKLIVEGEILASNDNAKQVMQLAKAGYVWQASVGADVRRHQRFGEDQTATVNGQAFVGPVRVVKASALRELSFVTLGADSETSVSIAAQAVEEPPMADNANQTPADAIEAKVEATAIVAVEPTPAITKESDMSELKAIVAKELKDELLAEIRASRGSAPAIHVTQPAANADEVVQASLCMAGGLGNVEKHFDERTLEAARRSGVSSIQEVLVNAARANGYDGSYRLTSGNLQPVLRAAFATHSISDILAATVNKFLLQGFTAVESVWDQISSIRSVADFKAVTDLRLNGGFEFQEVGNAGELVSADASSEKRTVSAKSYGRITSITRQDMINDDLGAVSVFPQRLGRGAAIKLNKVFWTTFEDSNSSYYQKVTAASTNALSLDSLKTATTAYRKLKDPDGNPLAIPARILLVPPELELTAAQLMTSSLLITGENSTQPNVNVLGGRYRVVVSQYLTGASTGSQSTWFLMADPADLPAMTVAFLNGQRQPVIETAQADFDVLGIQVRGYHDWGVSKAESLSTLRMAYA